MKLAGNTQQYFMSSHHAKDGAVYAMKVLNDGSNLFITSRNKILQSRGDSLIIHQPLTSAVQQIRNHAGGVMPVLYNIQQPDDEKILITNQWNSFEYGLHTRSFLESRLSEPGFREADYFIDLGNTHPFFIKCPKQTDSAFSVEARKGVDILVQNGRSRRLLNIPFTTIENTYWRNLSASTGGSFYFSIHNKLIVITKDLSYNSIEFPKRIISLYADRSGGLWAGLATGGGYYFSSPGKEMQLSDAQKTLSDLSVSGFCVDGEGSLWCTTLERGVYFAPSPHIVYFPGTPLSDRRSYFLRRSGDKVYTSSRIDELFTVTGSSLNRVKIDVKQDFEISDVIHFKGYLYVATKAYLYQLKENRSSYQMVTVFPNSLYEFASNGKRLYGLTKRWLVEVSDKSFRKYLQLPTTALCMAQPDSSHLLIGSEGGIYKIGLRDSVITKLPGCSVPVSRILICRDKSIYLTTYGSGLCKLDGDSVVRVPVSTLPDGLNDLTEDKNGRLWLASRKGLICFNKENNIHYLLNRSNGLMSDYVNKLTTDDHNVYVSTNEGLCVIPLTAQIFNAHAPGLRLRKWTVNGQIKSSAANVRLHHTNHDISCTFDLLSFKRGGAEGIMYQLSPYDTGYSFSRDSVLSYKHLPPGQYKLTAYAVNNNGVRSETPLTHTFSIALPFWKTKGFIAGCSLLLAALVYFIIWFITRRIRRKEAEKTEWNKLIADSRLSALQSQMNPHFIFNSINSIQNYILDKNAQEAYGYLSKFSKLIRKVLMNSREKAITLENELETLRLYIELERLRFDESFDYVINIPPDIHPQEIMIPTMIIQPYVENAIWHGLMNLKGERRGKLTLTFNTDDHFLIIIIDDNGVGRKQAAAFRQQNIHKPEGLNITSERIDLINRMSHRKDNAVQIFDKRDADGYSLGTRVEITINTKQYGES